MQFFLNRPRRFCAYAQLPIRQLSNEQLLTRRTKNRQMGIVVGLLMLLMLVLTFVMETYLVAATTASVLPALDQYLNKRKDIANELRKRNLR